MYDGLYFCGKKLSNSRTTETVVDMKTWSDLGFCYEMSGLALLIMYNAGNTSTAMTYCRARNFNHCFLEFELEGFDYIADFSWTTFPHLLPKEDYYSQIKQIEIENRYSFDEIFRRHGDYIVKLADCITRPETSNIFRELTFFRPNPDEKGTPICSKVLEKVPCFDDKTGTVFKPFLHADKLINKKKFYELYNRMIPLPNLAS